MAGEAQHDGCDPGGKEPAGGGPTGTAGTAARAPGGPPDGGIVERAKTRTVRRRSDPYSIVEKIKLWPSKTGVLHGVRSVRLKGGVIEVQTHCGQATRVRNSRNGRLARQLRNKRFETVCPRCRVPAWKIEKFEGTTFI